MMSGLGGCKTASVGNMVRLILLGMIPAFAHEASGDALTQEADNRGFLRNDVSSEAARQRGLQSGGVCGVDFPGIRSSGGTGDFCCPEGCGQCGGVGCSSFGKAMGLTKADCCTASIRDAGVLCSDSSAPPCIVVDKKGREPEPKPAYEFVRCSEMEVGDAAANAFYTTTAMGDLTLKACYDTCAAESALYFAVIHGTTCACGDSSDFLDASDRPLGMCDTPCPGTTSENCGGAASYDLYKIIADVGTADEELPTCSSGIVGVESDSGDVCCIYTCGTCGGDRCVGWGDCCEETIQAEEEMCSVTNEAPCIYNKVEVEPRPTPAQEILPALDRDVPSCSNGMPGLMSEDGATCCWEGCSTCIGMGEDCVGVTDCCEEAIWQEGVFCSDDGVEAGPCIMDLGLSWEPTSAPTSAPTAVIVVNSPDTSPPVATIAEDPETTAAAPGSCGADGFPGIMSPAGDVCCPAGCRECGGSKCVGYGECCEEKIHDDGILCSKPGVSAGPCIIVPRVNARMVREGCWKLGSDGGPFDTVEEFTLLNPQKCANHCAIDGEALYGGVMAGNLCGCGSDPDFLAGLGTMAEGDCNMICLGEGAFARTEYCGGSDSFGLLRIIYEEA